MLNELWDSLTDEQKAKVKECKTADGLVELAGREMIELPDEMLDAVSGGGPTNHFEVGKHTKKKKTIVSVHEIGGKKNVL
jgi:hypothetical protein